MPLVACTWPPLHYTTPNAWQAAKCCQSTLTLDSPGNTTCLLVQLGKGNLEGIIFVLGSVAQDWGHLPGRPTKKTKNRKKRGLLLRKQLRKELYHGCAVQNMEWGGLGSGL